VVEQQEIGRIYRNRPTRESMILLDMKSCHFGHLMHKCTNVVIWQCSHAIMRESWADLSLAAQSNENDVLWNRSFTVATGRIAMCNPGKARASPKVSDQMNL
jgi:hypothetical protein